MTRRIQLVLLGMALLVLAACGGSSVQADFTPVAFDAFHRPGPRISGSASAGRG
ncbi:MAG: hypothetical protein R2856_21440 [Caldilineaceae bacterium]